MEEACWRGWEPMGTERHCCQLPSLLRQELAQLPIEGLAQSQHLILYRGGY